jgi:hypothetical protein
VTRASTVNLLAAPQSTHALPVLKASGVAVGIPLVLIAFPGLTVHPLKPTQSTGVCPVSRASGVTLVELPLV